MDFYKTEKDHLILIYDDLDLDAGRIRLRAKGSAGTHNGMRSVVAQLGYSDFPRIRIGIGDPENKDAIGHVIGKISKNEKEILSDAVDKAADAAVSIITDGIERAMNIFNGNN